VLTWGVHHGVDYDLEVSDDAIEWKVVRRVTDGDGGIDHVHLDGIEARYVRVNGHASSGEWHLCELQVYEDEVAAPDHSIVSGAIELELIVDTSASGGPSSRRRGRCPQRRRG
jgi:F5/8 type C domain